MSAPTPPSGDAPTISHVEEADHPDYAAPPSGDTDSDEHGTCDACEGPGPVVMTADGEASVCYWCAWSLVSAERDAARAERDGLRAALDWLVRLKDGPRDDAYRSAKEHAWERARLALIRTPGDGLRQRIEALCDRWATTSGDQMSITAVRCELAADTTDAEETTRRLCCPYCGKDIEAILEYTNTYHGSEHRDLTGYECEDYACDARWDKRGNVTQPSKLAAADTTDEVAT